MSLQRMKANDNGINLSAEFINCGTSMGKYSPMIIHDEHRIK